MKGIASWFVGKSNEEEKQKFQILSDNTKSSKKRYIALCQLIKLNALQGSDRVHEFLRPILQQSIEICISFLRQDNTRTKGKAAWEEISGVLKTLVDITKYRNLPNLECINEVASACLIEGNRWEVRDMGFNLVLNLLNNNLESDIPSILFTSTIDFSQVKSEESKTHMLFNNKIDMTNSTNTLDFSWVNLVKSTEPSPPLVSKLLGDLEKLGLTKGAKECIYFLSRTFEFALGGEGQSKVEHFSRWFQKIKGNLLFLIYPKMCERAPKIGHDWGFTDSVPHILHSIVVKWLIAIVKTSELNPLILDGGKETEILINILGSTFNLSDGYNSTSYDTLSLVIGLYQDWIMYNFINDSIKQYWPVVLEKLFDFGINIFDFTNDTSPRRVQMCGEYLKMIAKCKDNQDRVLIFNTSLKIALKSLSTQDPNRQSQDIIEMVSEFLINTLAYNYENPLIQWSEYTKIIQNWSIKSEFIVNTWLVRMKPITKEMKDLNFVKSGKLEGWLNFMKVLGSPLDFQEKVQVKWVQALQEIINLIINPPQQSPSANTVLEFFFLTLSRLVRQGAKESQKLALAVLVNIFVATRSDELPMQCYLQHLSLLIYLSLEKDYLAPTAIENSPRVMDYPGMHFLIWTLLKSAAVNQQSSLRLLFYIMNLPNYYGSTKLENTDDVELTYLDLKGKIQDLIIQTTDDVVTAVPALFGLTVFILEELEFGNERVSELVVSVILPKSLHENEAVAITSLECLQNLSQFFPSLNKTILEFLISRCLTEIPNSKEKVIKSVLSTIQNWLLINNSAPCESSLLSSLFSALSSKLQLIDSSNPLESEISTMVSFISIYYLNFPFKSHSSSVFHSIISDSDFAESPTVKPLHYSLGSSVIFTMIPNPDKAKFILRNQFGRFCWEAYDFMVFEPATSTEQIEKAMETMQSCKIELAVKDPPPQLQDEPLLPKLLDFIKENYPECYVPEKPVESSSEILKMIDSVEKMESECSYEEKKPEREKYAFNMGRFFIANFGLIDKLVQLQVDDRFERGLGIIDGLKPREGIKIGVIYVAPGQQDEREILMNTGGSVEFQEFLRCLGDVVDIREHQGYLGALDPSGSAGNLSISYADWQYDVIFHIVPLMPTDPSDEQQVQKKRHVGNDIVHIVWSDHWRDYKQDTMLTHFNFIIIVIYPLSKGLFRIQIMKKINVDCGPLQDGMVVTAPLLPVLVRQTAIHANMLIRLARLTKHPNYEKQTHTRKKQIQELIQRYPSQQVPKHQVYAAMF